jgi:hypothetical protein
MGAFMHCGVSISVYIYYSIAFAFYVPLQHCGGERTDKIAPEPNPLFLTCPVVDSFQG